MKSDKEAVGINKPVEPLPAGFLPYRISGSFSLSVFPIVPLVHSKPLHSSLWKEMASLNTAGTITTGER